MKKQNTPFRIIYEDKEIIAVYKRSGLLSIAKEPGDYNNLYHQVREYINHKNEKIFVVHRLDRDTSGILVFAKNIRMKEILQKEFEERKVRRIYEALIQEHIPLGTKKRVVQYLKRNLKSNVTYVSKKKEGAKEAITNLTAVSYHGNQTVLKIEIETGRQNQIRLALLSLHYTLIGDKKYQEGQKGRMMLNAYRLIFSENCPIKKKEFSTAPLWLTETNV